MFHRLVTSPVIQKWITNQFHKIYYLGDDLHPGWKSSYWLGIQTLKCPIDLWTYQEIIQELMPDKIIETGTYHGGSALFLASICDLLNQGHVISIDRQIYAERPNHSRIQYLIGSSTDPNVIQALSDLVLPGERCMVILDSDHQKDHVLDELYYYHPFVAVGSYLIVEDTNLGGNPVLPECKPGPAEAVKEFLLQHKNFIIDTSREKHRLSFNPNGYLKKIST